MSPLFPRPVAGYSDEDLLRVQRIDHEELLAFLASLRGLVRRAVQLRPNEETQVILDLKAELEKHYEEASGLADAQGGNKQAVARLIDVIMNTIACGARGDPLAEQELAQEAEARRRHFELLEVPLVADLLHPQTLIGQDELAAVMLTDPEEQVLVALELFDASQLEQLIRDAEECLERNVPVVGERETGRIQLLRDRLNRIS